MASLEIIKLIPSKEDLVAAYSTGDSIVLKKKNLQEDIEYLTSVSLMKIKSKKFQSEQMQGMQYLGSGAGGSVYRLINDDGSPSNKAIKVVRTFPKYRPGTSIPFDYSELLSKTSPSERNTYESGGIKSMTMNRFQADFFRELINRQVSEEWTPNSLPELYQYVEGPINKHLRKEIIREDPDGSKKFPNGSYVAIWIMEYIPCIWANDFCGKTESDRNWNSIRELNSLQYNNENEAYNSMATFALDDLGYVMKDLRNPRNFGFRENGEVVFFDPVVIPYPSQNLDTNTSLMSSLVYGFGGEKKFTEAIKNGTYYKLRLF